MKNKLLFYPLMSLLILLTTNISLAVNTNLHVGNVSRELLTVLKWDERYEQERQKDVSYLLSSIDGALLQGFTSEQKEQVIFSMRNAVLNQLLADKDNFKNYLLNQYNQFFTADEMISLVKYFKTAVMQMVIQSQVDHKQLVVEQINYKLNTAGRLDKEIIEKFRDSYLNARYARFQEKVNPLVNKMIFERLKEILALAIVKLPDLIKAMQAHQSINLDLKIPKP